MHLTIFTDDENLTTFAEEQGSRVVHLSEMEVPAQEPQMPLSPADEEAEEE